MTKHYTYTQSQFGKYFTNVARIMRKNVTFLFYLLKMEKDTSTDWINITLVGYNLRPTTKMIVSLLFELFSMP